jgi:cystathionine beta-lyase
LNLSCRAVGVDEDEVLTLIPIYPPFLSAPRHSNRGVVRVPLIQDRSRWEIDFDLLEKSITTRTKLFMLCNPHNPVGRVYSRDELTQICAFCETHDLIICSDEIHCDLYLDQDKKHIPIASLTPEILSRTITLMAPSKTFNLPGLGCSFAMISDPDLRKRFLRAMAGVVPDVNVLGYAAALAAYRDGESWLQALLKYLRSNQSVVEKRINRFPGLAMTPVEATYLAWVKVELPGIEDPPVFFEQAGVGLSDGRDFGTPGFVRLNFGCPQSTLVAALDRMESAISTINK